MDLINDETLIPWHRHRVKAAECGSTWSFCTERAADWTLVLQIPEQQLVHKKQLFSYRSTIKYYKYLYYCILLSSLLFVFVHRSRSSVHFKGQDIFAGKICMKN